ncbi:MAG: DUF1841 family protein [Legionella sp.]|jgi:hypothetical protein
MFYGDTLQETRQFYFSSWRKYRQKQALQPLEQQIVAVILAHPEYHEILDYPEHYQEHTYYPELGESNPFLHMGLHLAIREQVATNRPAGITQAYENLLKKLADPLAVEHQMMEQLAECLWLAQKNNLPPDEDEYLRAISQGQTK